MNLFLLSYWPFTLRNKILLDPTCQPAVYSPHSIKASYGLFPPRDKPEDVDAVVAAHTVEVLGLPTNLNSSILQLGPHKNISGAYGEADSKGGSSVVCIMHL